MKKVILLFTILMTLALLSQAKPVYEFKTSYVTQLTNFNFRDQVTKIRQNTNYVSVVQFYKYNGKNMLIQMENLYLLQISSTNGLTSTMECSGLELLIAISILSFALKRVFKSTQLLKYILPHLSQPPPSLYLFKYLGGIYSLKSTKSCC